MAPDRGDRPDAKAARLFVAFAVSDAALDEVDRAIEPWRARFPRARWVPRENMHVTLKFLGQTRPDLQGWVHEQVGAVADVRGAVATRLTGLGSFASAARARVLWVGIEDPEGAFASLAGALDGALEGSFGPEVRAFSPHLTVARSDPPLKLDEGFARSPVESVGFRVEEIVLYRSHLGRPAPRYEPIATFVLGG
ncbi:MAG: RNA 2',3'-cyclic phosphodiesterase [Actinomycetota bacterium]|nr:RNA 2',3'-cyclic phosphodiesterase [Actinomycetota bacterium]